MNVIDSLQEKIGPFFVLSAVLFSNQVVFAEFSANNLIKQVNAGAASKIEDKFDSLDLKLNAKIASDLKLPNPFDTANSGDGAAGDWLGYDIAISGNTALVGAPKADILNQVDAGAVYVYVRVLDNWELQTKLVASDVEAGDHFGWSVSISGDTAVIGSYLEDNAGGVAAGSAYVFDRTGTSWTQTTKLIANDGSISDWFGWSVRIDNNFIAIGAPLDDENPVESLGSVYLFKRDLGIWAGIQKLKPSNLSDINGYQFGTSIALLSNTLVVGAPSARTSGSQATGAVFVFNFDGNNWIESQKLLGTNTYPTDEFGTSVALSQDDIFVGEYHESLHIGAVYVFSRSGNTWTQSATLSSDGKPENRFGARMSIQNNLALIGCFACPNNQGTGVGQVYVFRKLANAWVRETVVQASDGASQDWFGHAVAQSANLILIGAPQSNGAPGIDAGSFYSFTNVLSNWNQTNKTDIGDDASNDLFGSSVALTEQYAVIGAAFDDSPSGTDSGSVSVYKKNGGNWDFDSVIYSPVQIDGQEFGRTVVIDKETIAIGAPRRSAVFIYVRVANTWQLQDILVPSDAQLGRGFGESIALEGNTIVVGMRLRFGVGFMDLPGAAYLFKRENNEWIQRAVLTASDGIASDEFGTSVALDGKTILIGSPYSDFVGQTNAGSAYFFTEQNDATWAQFAKVSAADSDAGDRFGNRVALRNSQALISAPFDEIPPLQLTGSVYAFNLVGNAWQQSAKLTASNPEQSDFFGASLVIGDQFAIFGSGGDDNQNGANAGSVYVYAYENSGWRETNQIIADDGLANDNFGHSISIHADKILIGALSVDSSVSQRVNVGAAYLIDNPLMIFRDSFESQ